MIMKIFIPITGSDESKIATDKAIEMAAFLNAKVVAIHVLDNEALAKLQRYKIFIEEESSIFGDSLKKDAEKYLNYAKNLAESFHVDIETVLLEGDPFSEMTHHIVNDPASQKFVIVARTSDSDSFIETFGSLEKKLLRSRVNVIVTGE